MEALQISHTPNRFFLWQYGASSPAEIDPVTLSESSLCTDVRYFGKILVEVDRQLGSRGLQFLLTWNLDKFADQFCDSIVILVGDEKYQIPTWAPSVRAIFKTGGRRKPALRTTLTSSPSIAWRLVLRDLRNLLLTVRRRGRTVRSAPAPIYEVPLGYFALVDVPYVPFNERTTDVYFAGAAGALGRWSPRPRVAARREMAAGLRQAKVQSPTLKIANLSVAASGCALDATEYSAQLMQAKIAVCPRGNFDETFRLFEAAKSGCVVISEPLPDRWYYGDMPVIELRRWSSLPSLLREVFTDEGMLADVAARTQKWWERRAAERPVAEYICGRLGTATRP